MASEDLSAQPNKSMPIERSVSFLKTPGAEEFPVGPLVFFLITIMALDGADAALFPGLGKALERTIGFNMQVIANLATVQALIQAVFGPFWGVVCARNYLERKTILAAMTFCQGLVTFIMCFSLESDATIIFLRGLNGACLAGLLPVANSVIADRFDDEIRGRMFALMNMSRGLGNTLASFAYIRVSEWCVAENRFDQCPTGDEGCDSPDPPACECSGFWGWEWCFMVVGGATMAFAPVIFTLMKPPPVTAKNVVNEGENVVVAELKGLGALLAGTPTFAILVVQGFFGGLPFTALSFRVLYFQTVGLTNAQASDIAFAIGIIGIIGGGFSGWLSDFLTSLTRFHGRILNAEFSVYGGIPFAFFTFNLMWAPTDTDSLYWYFMTLSLLMHGICGGVGGGTNAPILAQLAEPADRALIIAWQGSLEGCITAFGPAVFAFLSGIYGYDSRCNPGCNRPDFCDPDPDTNANAAGTALLFTSCVPWTICGLMYSSLHYFYPRDMERIFERRRLEAEAQGRSLSTELVNS